MHENDHLPHTNLRLRIFVILQIFLKWMFKIDKYAHIVHAMEGFLPTALLFAWSWHLAVDEVDVVDGHPGVELRSFLLLKTNLVIVEKWDKSILIITVP